MSASLFRPWLDKATEDLAVARLVLKEGHTAHACLFSQQCIEKSLKAFLIARARQYPRTHNLVDLLDQCRHLEAAFAQFLSECQTVDSYYIPTRYPDGMPGSTASGLPSEREAEEATDAAERILQFVTRQIQ